MLSWKEAHNILATVLGTRLPPRGGRSSDERAVVVRSVLLMGEPAVGKHALIKSVVKSFGDADGADGAAADKQTAVRVVDGDLTTVLSNPKRGGGSVSSQQVYPFASTWRCLPSSSSLSAAAASASITATAPAPELHVVLWSDLHLCIGGASSFAADADFGGVIVEQICASLLTELPKTSNVVVVGIMDTPGGSSSTSNSGGNNGAASGNSSRFLKQAIRLLSRVFDVVLEVDAPSALVRGKIATACERLLDDHDDADHDDDNDSTSSSLSVARRQRRDEVVRSTSVGRDIAMKAVMTRGEGWVRASSTSPCDASSSSSSLKVSEPNKLTPDGGDRTIWDTVVGHDDVKRLLQSCISVSRGRPGCSGGGHSSLVMPPPPPLGILMCGIPGTGKTMLARCLARSMRWGAASNNLPPQQQRGAAAAVTSYEDDSSASDSFFVLNASSLVSAEVGVSERNLTSTFELARRRAPSVIFIDEIQAVFRRTTTSSHASSLLSRGENDNEEQEGDHHNDDDHGGASSLSPSSATTMTMMPPHERRLVTTLLRCLDKNRSVFTSSSSSSLGRGAAAAAAPVIVVGATNVPSLVEPALLRHGRLSHIVHVRPPSVAELQGMVKKWLKRQYDITFEDVDDDDASGTVESSSSVAQWLVSRAIVDWAQQQHQQPSSSSSSSASPNNSNNRRVSRATGADVTGLLNLIDLRLASKFPSSDEALCRRQALLLPMSAAGPADMNERRGAEEQKTTTTTTTTTTVAPGISCDEMQRLIESALARVRPSVEESALEEIDSFVAKAS